MNNANLIGRLTRDPELRKTDDGLSICDFTIAVDDVFSKDDRTDFIRVTAFGNQAENCDKYLRKGFICGASGRIHTESYTDKEGVKRNAVKIIADRIQFLQFPDRSEGRTNEAREEAR